MTSPQSTSTHAYHGGHRGHGGQNKCMLEKALFLAGTLWTCVRMMVAHLAGVTKPCHHSSGAVTKTCCHVEIGKQDDLRRDLEIHPFLCLWILLQALKEVSGKEEIVVYRQPLPLLYTKQNNQKKRVQSIGHQAHCMWQTLTSLPGCTHPTPCTHALRLELRYSS
jgi:hypothetical protein